jgi:patatin-like phospholipase/acyl hydrolase
MVQPFRVLSIDGGGIRGLYTAVLLHGLAQRVTKMHGNPVDNLDVGRPFDLIVGTSTGAILATALASGIPLEDVITFYKNKASSIFADPFPQKKISILSWAWRSLRTAANQPEALQEALYDVFGDETVEQMYERRGIALCIPTIDLESQKAWVYKTPHDKCNNRLQRDNDYSLVDICMSSSAAPIVFPVHGVRKPKDIAGNINWFVDGGLWANNPVIIALVEALSFAPQDAPIEVISVSTCPPFKGSSVDRQCCSRGVLDWKGGIRMMEVAIDAQSWAYDYMAKTLATHLSDRVKYIRLTDPDVGVDEAKELRFDNPSEACLKTLVKLGNRAIDQNISEATTGDKPKALLVNAFAALQPLQ